MFKLADEENHYQLKLLMKERSIDFFEDEDGYINFMLSDLA